MNILEELKFRYEFAIRRIKNKNKEIHEAGIRDLDELLEITSCMDEHPDEWDGPCYCKMCKSYSDEWS
jgi:hypothetical protein